MKRWLSSVVVRADSTRHWSCYGLESMGAEAAGRPRGFCDFCSTRRSTPAHRSEVWLRSERASRSGVRSAALGESFASGPWVGAARRGSGGVLWAALSLRVSRLRIAHALDVSRATLAEVKLSRRQTNACAPAAEASSLRRRGPLEPRRPPLSLSRSKCWRERCLLELLVAAV